MNAKDVDKLYEENKQLKKKIKKLEKEKESIHEEKEKVEKEYEELKAKHALTVQNLQKALKIKPEKKITKNKAGAQLGHKAYTRRIPERIDYVKQLNPKKCPHCHHKLPLEASEIRTRYVTDVALVMKTITKKYDIHRKYCTHCKKIVEQAVPNVLPHAQYGLNLMLLIMYLRLGLRLPGNKVREYLLTLHNLSISEGEIAHILKQLAKAFGKYYTYLQKLARKARVKHTDTTGWRVNGRSYHAWVFIAAGVVLYKITKRNNHKTPLRLFGTQQENKTLVVDRHSAFRTLAEKVGFLLQLCWSHILEDSKKLAKDFGKEGKYVHTRLKNIFADAKSFDHRGTTCDVSYLKQRVYYLTKERYTCSTVRKFVNALWKRDSENLFRFVTDPEVDPTNNISERELRSLVIIRKISNGSRSVKGANITATLLSIIQTARKKNKHLFETLVDIINNPSGY